MKKKIDIVKFRMKEEKKKERNVSLVRGNVHSELVCIFNASGNLTFRFESGFCFSLSLLSSPRLTFFLKQLLLSVDG